MCPRLPWWLLIALACGANLLLASFVVPNPQTCTGCGEGVVLILVFASPVIAAIVIFSSVKAMRAWRLETLISLALAAIFVIMASYFYVR